MVPTAVLQNNNYCLILKSEVLEGSLQGDSTRSVPLQIQGGIIHCYSSPCDGSRTNTYRICAITAHVAHIRAEERLKWIRMFT
jgi:hypothetical protein